MPKITIITLYIIILLSYQSQEGPKVTFKERPEKEVSHGYARVKILAASLNHRDEWIRHGFYKLGDNYIMGSDACGIVEEVKDEKYVVLGPDDGTFREKIVVQSKNLVVKPVNLTPEQAATMSIAGL
ncbi:24660_t:CDS:2, partial [Dentiscutata erythropus]